MQVHKLTEDHLRGARRAYDGLSRGDRATLKRASTPDQMLLEGAFWRVASVLPEEYRSRLACVVVGFPAAAQRNARGFRVGTFLRRKLHGKQTLKPAEALVFRRILACEDRDELARAIRRVLVRIDAGVDWGVLGLEMIFWGDSIKRRWAQDFYAPSKENSDVQQ